MKTEDNISDKKIPSFLIKKYLLNHRCRNNSFIKNKAIDVCKLFMKNKYIDLQLKNEINEFLNN